VKPRRFAYHAPKTLDDALATLSEHQADAKVLAGGQSLMPLMAYRMAAPEHLVDINNVEGLSTIQRTAGGWTIPALVRHRDVERSSELAATHQMVGQAAAEVAHPQIRNRGTVCGSLAHADPAAEFPTVMTALGATMVVSSARGTRRVEAADFFQFHFTTVLEDDELLQAVEVPDPPPGATMAFAEFAMRRGDFALAGVAAVVMRAPDGGVTDCRLVASGVAPVPHRLTGAEQLVRQSAGGGVLPRNGIREAVMDSVDPTGDAHGSADYRRSLVATLACRVLEKALGADR
jgi:carbon-monoxide dehydrogenase medium subunit